MRLDLVVIFDNGSRWVYEIKSLASCPSNYGSRWKNKAKAWGAGASPADAKAATTATDRAAKASGIDERLGFRGKDGVAHALKGIGKVVGLAVGGARSSAAARSTGWCTTWPRKPGNGRRKTRARR